MSDLELLKQLLSKCDAIEKKIQALQAQVSTLWEEESEEEDETESEDEEEKHDFGPKRDYGKFSVRKA